MYSEVLEVICNSRGKHKEKSNEMNVTSNLNVGDMTNSMWTVVKLVSQKNDFSAPVIRTP